MKAAHNGHKHSFGDDNMALCDNDLRNDDTQNIDMMSDGSGYDWTNEDYVKNDD